METPNVKIEGKLEKVKPPYFNSKRGFYVVCVKVLGQWKYFWRRKESDANEVYSYLCTIRDEQLSDSQRQSTHLTEKFIRECEVVFDRLSAKYGEKNVLSNRLLSSSVEQFIKRTPSLLTPSVEECAEMFLKYKTNYLAATTLKDYHYLLRRFTVIFGDMPIGEIGPDDVKEYFNHYSNSHNRTQHHYLKGFFEFCKGVDNPHTYEGVGWITHNPISWKAPKLRRKQPDCLAYNDIVNVLLLTEGTFNGRKTQNHTNWYCKDQNEVIAYYIFRLFTMIRRYEYLRLFRLGGTDITKNKYIDLDRGRLILTPDLYKKKGSTGGNKFGRIMEPFCDAFKSWLEWMVRWDIRLKIPYETIVEKEVKQVCKNQNLDSFNILRHTAITYHLLNFKRSAETAKSAGTSLRMIEHHYWSKNLPTADAERFFTFDIHKANELSIIRHV